MNGGISFEDPAPLYAQIEQDIKNKIKNGILKPGEKIPPHTELSKAYNVSLITLKKALSNLIREGVLFTRVGRGTYIKEYHSTKFNPAKHKTIGLVLRYIKHPFFSMIVHSVENRAYELGYNILLSNSSGNIQKEEAQINHFRELGVDALIIASLSLEYRANEYIQKLHDENFPYIMVSYMHDPDYWYVGSDHELGGYMAAEHLIKLGYKTFGYAHIGKGNLLSEVRKNGFYRAMIEHDIPMLSQKVFYLGKDGLEAGADRFQLGYEFGLEFLKFRNRPEALGLYSDLVALGFEKALFEKGARIPDDVGIIGFDDIEIARFASVPLTTIHQPAEKIGKLAVDILQKRIAREEIGNRTIVQPELIVRSSCGAVLKSAGNM